MARDATISQQEVDAVAEQLRVGGERPTARAVRERLGRGSMATVLRYLQVWQAGQARPVDSAVALPPALQRSLVDFVGQEVTSRMKRRGKVKSRLLPVSFDGTAPSFGQEVLRGDLRAGEIRSSCDGRGMALLRLDRLDGSLSVEGQGVQVHIPDWLELAG